MIGQNGRSADVDAFVTRGVITVRKARVGWWVNGRWCPTKAIQQHEIRRIRELAGQPLRVRTPG